MVSDARTLALLKQRLDEAERNIQYVRQALDDPQGLKGDIPKRGGGGDEALREGEKIIEGVFNGRNMTGNDGNEYPVPPNYASKSKLVEGDAMKLTIALDGAFTYKQTRPVERKRLIGVLVTDEEGTLQVKAEGKLFNILLASVTFYKIEEGDEVAILVPAHGEAKWGAVEHVIHSK
jgi:hypothetical protein